ncbi:hypothetical protein CBL_09209 [Carabus blaptoides fortunei]
MEDDEVQTFGRCDCKSYSYFALSMLLFSVGTVVTVMALGDAADGFIFYHLGHMWLVGPIFICSGLMVAVKSMLYLRRKSIIQMLLHQRAIFRELAAQQAAEQHQTCMMRSASSATLPPSYEALVPPCPSASVELPPPTYEEALYLISPDKHKPVVITGGATHNQTDKP